MKITIREYATTRHVTYENVRRQIKKHSEELKDHVSKNQDDVTVLDETAQEILDRHRQKRPVIVTASDEASQLKINTLTRDLAESRAQNAESQKEIIRVQGEYNELQKEVMKARNEMIEMQKKYHELLMQRDEELSSYRPSLFGLYRKVKGKTAAPSADQGDPTT